MRAEHEHADGESVYDAYVEHLLEGGTSTPMEFVAAREGSADEALLAAMDRLHRGATGRHPAGKRGATPFDEFEDYVLLDPIGRGSTGVVHLGRQKSLDRLVAIKLLRAEHWDSDEALERFRREARTLGRLKHESIVSVHDAGEHEGVAYLVMEYVQGASLADRIRDAGARPVPVPTRVRWIASIARALQHAHDAGVVHRDVKPSNVRVAEDDRALLVDFGLVRTTGTADGTLTRNFAGTPSFASPEQINGSSDVTARSDVYSLGVTLYWCLSGRVPFEGASIEELFHAILAGDARPLRAVAPDLPRDLALVVHKAMAREADQRYATAGAFAEDLEALLDLRPIRARPETPWRRLRRAVVRHRRVAVAALVTAVSLLALLVDRTIRRTIAAESDRATARELLQAARGDVEAYTAERVRLQGIRQGVVTLQGRLANQYIPAEDFQLLDRHEVEIERDALRSEESFHGILRDLDRAGRLDPSLEGIHQVRGALFLERYREAWRRGDRVGLELYRDLAVSSFDGEEPPAEVEELQREGGRLVLDSVPSGAEVHVFHYVDAIDLDPDGEPRRVAVPGPGALGREPSASDRMDSTPDPGTWALLVRESTEALLEGDLIIEVAGHKVSERVFGMGVPDAVSALCRLRSVDGAVVRSMGDLHAATVLPSAAERVFEFRDGAEDRAVSAVHLADAGVTARALWQIVADKERGVLPAVVYRDGETKTVQLPPGLDVRCTAAPLFRSARSLVGTTPLEIEIQRDSAYGIVLRAPGFMDQRVGFAGGMASMEQTVVLVPRGALPEGFVPIAGRPESPSPFAILEREIRSDEYLQFLNQAETLARIDGAQEPMLYPRQRGALNGGSLWEREGAGGFSLPEGWPGDWPVLGVSWHDARAYAAWRTERARAAGKPWTFSLPTRIQHVRAGGDLAVNYAFGRKFRPHWARSCFAHSKASPSSVEQYPIDESPYGIRDLSGCAAEWLDEWYDEARGLRLLAGGAWGQGDPERFKLYGGVGAAPEASSGETGFRLVVSIVDDATETR